MPDIAWRYPPLESLICRQRIEVGERKLLAESGSISIAKGLDYSQAELRQAHA